jgi:hypothetical protein
MSIDRREFLASLTAISGSIFLDPDRLAFAAQTDPRLAYCETFDGKPVGGTFSFEIAGRRTREFPHDAPLDEVRAGILMIAPEEARVNIRGGHLVVEFVGK